MKIIVLGANGMLGHLLYSEFKKNHQVWGTVRSNAWDPDLLVGFDVENLVKIEELIKEKKPDFVINCIGTIKQREISNDKITSITVNSLWPHQLASICLSENAKLIHFSTDCVFSGAKGQYLESDVPDARDIYGLSKNLGELDYSHTLTLRTSIIGHEIESYKSLISWFFSQRKECVGYKEAYFSGFPTIVVAHFIEEFVFRKFVSGVYNFSSQSISKFDLLSLVAKQYNKDIHIIPNREFKIDRSLNSDRIRNIYNWQPASWEEMIQKMHEHFKKTNLYK